MHKPLIGVVGLGFVGLTLAATLASRGYDVIGVDIDEEKVRAVREAKPPFYEPGLDELLAEAQGRLEASTSYEPLVDADIVFIAVPTPTLPDRRQDTRYIEEAIKRLAEVHRGSSRRHIVAVKSTVLPGTTRRLARLYARVSGRSVPGDTGFAANPEFLREGNAVNDLLHPHRVIIGALDEKTGRLLEDFWRSFYERVGRVPPIVQLTPEEAELAKYAANAFLALRISFANTIADLCEETPNCDAVRVLYAAGLDPRIGTQYLKPGLGYGGSCLPKDVSALIGYAESVGVNSILLKAVDEVNDERPARVVRMLEKLLGSLEGKVVAVLGLAYKPGTSDVRESKSIALVKLLTEKGATVRVHDPRALESARMVLGNTVVYCESVEDALRGADAAVIATDWPEYRRLTPSLLKRLMRRPVILDARRVVDPKVFEESGVVFYAVGRSAKQA